MSDHTKLSRGDMIMCNQGMYPSTFQSFSESGVGTKADNKLGVNIPPFGMCRSVANPAVSSAAAANRGAAAPGPCIPHIVTEWVGADDKGQLHNYATCTCAWGGTIRKV